MSDRQGIPKTAPISVHELKIWPEYFAAVKDGRKTFEVRKWDRDYKVGDRLILLEYDPESGEYTGDKVRATITYILGGKMAEPGVCIMSIRVLF